jgi:hypothetical protein
MFELLVTGLFLWIAFHLMVFSVKVAWGLAKVVGVGLFLLAIPVMLVCLMFVGGVFLLASLVLLIVYLNT